jgi:hypothetical protein
MAIESLNLNENVHTVSIRKPDCPVLSILCQSRPFETRTQKSGFGMVASLDSFIKKRVIINILFMTKGSRLAEEKVRSGFQVVAAILFLPSESRTNIVGTDLFVQLSNG